MHLLPATLPSVLACDEATRRERLQRALTLLPGEMRTVLRLRRSLGLSNQETAARMEQSEMAVRSLYARAMARLTVQMAKALGADQTALSVVLRAC